MTAFCSCFLISPPSHSVKIRLRLTPEFQLPEPSCKLPVLLSALRTAELSRLFLAMLNGLINCHGHATSL